MMMSKTIGFFALWNHYFRQTTCTILQVAAKDRSSLSSSSSHDLRGDLGWSASAISARHSLLWGDRRSVSSWQDSIQQFQKQLLFQEVGSKLKNATSHIFKKVCSSVCLSIHPPQLPKNRGFRFFLSRSDFMFVTYQAKNSSGCLF